MENSPQDHEQVAGNGLLHRRMFLAGRAAAVGASVAPSGVSAAPLPVEPWMKLPGAGFDGYGQPSKFEAKVARTFASAPGTTGTGSSRTPHHRLNGMITPSGLHYERTHSGIPDIDPDAHRVVIHGLVKRPLVFTLDDLARYPMESRIAFLECAGNSGALFQKAPARGECPGDPRPAVVRGMDRREARGAARGSRRRSRRRNGCSPKAPMPPA